MKKLQSDINITLFQLFFRAFEHGKYPHMLVSEAPRQAAESHSKIVLQNFNLTCSASQSFPVCFRISNLNTE